MTRQYPIILHHFEKSPFSEKIRIVFGLKKIAWTSVLIPRIMPRPDLMPKEFREDREQLRGQKFDVDAMKAAIPQMRDQLRTHVDWTDFEEATVNLLDRVGSRKGKHF